MNAPVYRFEFSPIIPLQEAEMTLQVAMFAAEGLLGESRIRLDFTFFVDKPRSAIYVDGTTMVGDAITRLFLGLLLREFGEALFSVCRVESQAARDREVKCA
jgi:hypothetical protein